VHLDRNHTLGPHACVSAEGYMLEGGLGGRHRRGRAVGVQLGLPAAGRGHPGPAALEARRHGPVRHAVHAQRPGESWWIGPLRCQILPLPVLFPKQLGWNLIKQVNKFPPPATQDTGGSGARRVRIQVHCKSSLNSKVFVKFEKLLTFLFGIKKTGSGKI
jgi:hypothetical protein